MAEDVPEHTLDLPAEGVAEAPRGFAPGATIGHFRIVREVGAGGMGFVFEAYDPDLDRRVAIKVLRDRRGQRLIAEAQAMARLAHPNVVAVHEVGTLGDQFFVVMELVAGGTLASWLARPHSWRDVVRMFVQAGDGLVAAHESGLVHGDFKPNNVLIDETGRARVADFGLARTDGDDAPHLATGSQPAGTPGYMAPEQIAGRPFDARADQYAFAVALREALQDREVPRRIARALDRALAEEPDQRFGALRELLDELRASLGTRRRAAVAAVGLAGTSAAIAALVAWSAAPAPDDCMAGAALVDDVWTGAARARLAGDATTARLLDDWVAAWRLGRRSACTAQPEQRPARVACLDGRLADLRAQLAVWERSDRQVLARALPAAAALPSPESCAVSDVTPTASFPLVVQRIALVNAFKRAGRSAEAKPLIAGLLADAEATGDRATFGHALYAAGHIEHDLAAHEQAADDFARAAREAAEVHDTTLLLDAMIAQAAVATDRGRPLEALGLLDAAVTTTGHAVDREPRIIAQLALARSDALTIAGRFPEAIEQARKAVALLEPIAGREHAMRVRFANALGALAAAEGLSMHHQEARDLLMRCLAIEEADYGPGHPEIAKTLHDLANQEGRLRHFDDARAHYDRARAILAAAYGERHHLVALTDYSLGGLELQKDKPADARPYFERALAELLASVGAQHPDVGRVEGALGSVERELDHCREAIPHLERARQVVERAGVGGTELAGNLTNLGACLADVGRDAEARPVLERSLAELARAGTPEVERTEANALLAEIEWRAGNHAAAIALAKSVLSVTAPADEPYKQLHDYMQQELAQWMRR